MPHTAGHRRARGRVVHRRHVHRGACGDFVFRRFRDRRLPWGWSRDSVKRSGAPSSTTERESASILMTVMPTDRRHRGQDHRVVTAVLVHQAHLELVGRPRRRGARDPPDGRRRLRSMEKDGRPEGKAGGQAAIGGRHCSRGRGAVRRSYCPPRTDSVQSLRTREPSAFDVNYNILAAWRIRQVHGGSRALTEQDRRDATATASRTAF